ncbi:diphthine--ammonia ligase [Candidatus Nitrosotenuis sp. DW1]|uniref:diphthine--ammonia ligase n=1 Tax=Candidatus Nitrosotenuis sp. DW1 TaxID=2259672 RepID=UPI0015CA5724|nr:diphthine--ammonia ligase [Candidatus Nitrosotenuis sp. DW1]QLH08536.1 diphthine--ammonia ligase [Candidatus Nitrosotenuis sp. DW1]
MNLAALFSGGKDSTYSIFEAKNRGHAIKCLVTILASSDDSHLLHHPNVGLASLQAKSMKIPQITISAKSSNTESELESLREALSAAKKDYQIEGIVHGGILSEFQKTKFEGVAKDLGLHVVSPLWKKNQTQYMHLLLDSGFEFIITSVSADGLDKSWLGKKITKDDLVKLEQLSEKHKFNLSFEGGEAETFVVNCPLFSGPIEIQDSSIYWDGYRGRFEIVRAKIKDNAG